jgi:hypothetical protein
MNEEQRTRVFDLVSELPWADFDAAILDQELNLRLALEATQEAFLMWEAAAKDNGFEDEFSLTPSQVRELPSKWRLAYVARLLRNLALSYGVSTEFGGGPLVGADYPATPAAILRGLNDISWTPGTRKRDVP